MSLLVVIENDGRNSFSFIHCAALLFEVQQFIKKGMKDNFVEGFLIFIGEFRPFICTQPVSSNNYINQT